MKKKYYKPKSLIIGLLIFGFSMLFIGLLLSVNVRNDIQDVKDILYPIGFIISIIGMVIGEGFILNAASYDDCNKKEKKKK